MVTTHHPGITRDPRGYAAVLVATVLGQLVLREPLSRALGADVLETAGRVRVGKALVDILSHPLIDPDLAATAHAAYDRLAASASPAQQDP